MSVHRLYRRLSRHLLARTWTVCGQFAGRIGLFASARCLFRRAVVAAPHYGPGHRGLGNVLRPCASAVPTPGATAWKRPAATCGGPWPPHRA